MNLKIFSLLGLFLLLAGCGTNREGDLRSVSKLYQNTTARYNGYFNAKELYRGSVKKLDDNYRDNYNRILPFYKHVAVENATTVAGDLDNAINKVTVVVNLHPQSKWVDNCYILSGQCQFLKKDYDAAQHTFEYMIKEFAPENLIKAGIKRKTKVDEQREKREAELAKKEGRDYRRTSARKKAARAKSKKKSKRLKSGKRKKTKTKKRRKDSSKKDPKKDKSREKRLKERNNKKKIKDKDATDKQVAQSREERLKARKKAKKESDKKRKEAAKIAARNKNRKERDEITQMTKPQSAPKTKKPKKTEAEPKISDDPKSQVASASNTPILEDPVEQERYFLKHKPSQMEAMLWLAKTYVAQKRYNDALFKLSSIRRDPSMPDYILEQIPEIQAYAYLEMKNYDDAIAPLKELIELKGNKKAARYQYILGQIYMGKGQNKLAAEAFAQVVKAHPDFEMEFNARINQVRSQWDGDQNNQQKLIDLLNKMLKENKNDEFQDQIHFALGEIYQKMGKHDEARKQMVLAAHKGKSNPHIQAEAYFVLADYAYIKKKYPKAKNYYDTSLQYMLKTDERYAPTDDRRNRLADVVAQLNLLALQDSLLRISQMSDDEKRLLAYQIKEKNSNKNSSASGSKSNNFKSIDMNAGAARRAGNFGSTSLNSSKSTFFAYDEKSVKRGLKDFTKIWGNRVLEDNWRRSRKQSSENSFTEEELDEFEAEELTEEEIGSILKDVPSSEEDIRKAQDIRMRALFLLAGYYYSRLDELDLSIKTFEEFIEQYPKSPFSEEVYYRLYLAYKEKGMLNKANSYKAMLEEKYADSEFVKIINDPNYYDKKMSEKLSLSKSYDLAYQSFQSGDAYKALQMIGQAKSDFANIPKDIRAKFSLLRAMCLGKTEGRDEYLKALDLVVTTHNGTDEAKRAKEIIRYIRGDKNVFGEKENKKKSRYVDQQDRLHYVLVLFRNTDKNTSINELRAQVSDYNRTYHKLEKLRVGNVYLSKDDKDPILIVRKFPTGQAAMKYYKSILSNKENFLPDSQYELFPINQRNYRELLRSKTLEEYIRFFEEHYDK